MTAVQSLKIIWSVTKLLGRFALDGRLIDPLEVFYLPGSREIFPINSKAGCSTVKLLLIRRFVPVYTAQFPEIHTTDPGSVTNGAIQRIFFYRRSEYDEFARGKKLLLVIREPVSRYLSFRGGIKDGANQLYGSIKSIRSSTAKIQSWSLGRLLLFTFLTPNALADRHFREQRYLLPRPGGAGCQITVTTLTRFVEMEKDQSGDAPVLNRGQKQRGTALQLYLRNKPLYRWRYRRDLALYRKITTLPRPRSKY
ncbi:hypothetical protein [Neolewinella antarctica]|uniref:Uncharacterized protein n=1 Tax=Neolewinella antarctica TaxID=442734 RepID=A0ABX0X8Y0_9BACT|nr:hypothetical protein [Neolewinella antarctica]NJC25394.1 hypothetical protein [Neolewinella antarctica]